MKSALICSAAKLPILGLLVFTGSNGTRQKKKVWKIPNLGGSLDRVIFNNFFSKKNKVVFKIHF